MDNNQEKECDNNQEKECDNNNTDSDYEPSSGDSEMEEDDGMVLFNNFMY